MKSFIQTLAVLSALATATPTLAHPTLAYPRHAHAFSAIDPRISPRGEPRTIPFGGAEDSQDTATGGPSGGLGG